MRSTSRKHLHASITAPRCAKESTRVDASMFLFCSMWINLGKTFNALSVDPDVRCIILSGQGEKGFTAGLDVRL